MKKSFTVSLLVTAALVAGCDYLPSKQIDLDKISSLEAENASLKKEVETLSDSNREKDDVQKCIDSAKSDFAAKKRASCINIYHEGADCEPMGRGTVGKALYDNYYQEISSCKN